MTLNICDGAHGAITVTLEVLSIVKANKNRISYGNTIALNFLLTGLNSFLKNVVNELPSAFPCEDVNAFVYDRTSKVLGLASSHIGIWVLFG